MSGEDLAHDWDHWLDVDAAGFLPQHDHAARRTALQARLGDLAAPPYTAALLVTGAANIRWVSGFTGSNGSVLVLPDRAVLLTDARYEGRAAVECTGLDVRITRHVVDDAVELAAAAGVDRLVFEGDHVSHRVGTGLQAAVAESALADVVSAHGVVEALRTVKDEAELARLARACAITEWALDAVLAAGLEGRTERDVARAVEDGFRQHDGAVGFATIVASGSNGAIPHHEPTLRVLQRGELVTIDCGTRIDGYHADTTRTVAVGAPPTGDRALLAEVYDVVAAAQQAGVDAAVRGATGGDVDRAARDVVEAAGHGEAFVHGTGHGVGLDIHEAPAVARGAAATLTPRTALTVEPGVYLPGRGGVRIEDTLVVTAEGPPRRLTHSPHTLRVA